MTSPRPFFATPMDVETAFYEALERADLDAMMSVWAEDEEIICILPGGPRLSSHMNVREAWRRLFDGGPRLRVRISHQGSTQNPFTAIHSVVEEVTLMGQQDAKAGTLVVATNVYVKGPLGWRLVVHHASLTPPQLAGEIPKVLH
jgi:ketosteroid isomerase-like protein